MSVYVRPSFETRNAKPMLSIRSSFFDAYITVWTALFAPLIPIFWATQSTKSIRRATRIWSKGILFGLHRIVGLNYREIGIENKLAGPAIYACNHQSMWETIASLSLVPDNVIIAKESLFRVPVFGWYLKHSPMIGIDRDAGAKALRGIVKESRAAVKIGRSIFIFPEGTRTAVDSRVPFQRGVALLYKDLNLPVVPMAVNSGNFWQSGTVKKRKGKITVSYMTPIAPGLDADAFMTELQDRIYAEKDRLAAN